MHSESIALSMHVHRLSASTIFFKGYNCSMCEIDNESLTPPLTSISSREASKTFC